MFSFVFSRKVTSKFSFGAILSVFRVFYCRVLLNVPPPLCGHLSSFIRVSCQIFFWKLAEARPQPLVLPFLWVAFPFHLFKKVHLIVTPSRPSLLIVCRSRGSVLVCSPDGGIPLFPRLCFSFPSASNKHGSLSRPKINLVLLVLS